MQRTKTFLLMFALIIAFMFFGGMIAGENGRLQPGRPANADQWSCSPYVYFKLIIIFAWLIKFIKVKYK